MMEIPDEIKENVRAVLLSKTDGSGILVSTLLRDYKAMIHKSLMYKDLGYDTLEKFIKDLPDVCRLEYSDANMAFKLFGIAKPNTYVSSFVKRAAEGSGEDMNSSRSNRKNETVRPTNDLNEKWEPSARGLYTLCFPNKESNGLDSREAVAMKFAQLGEVVEINMIRALTFVRYRDEIAAKKAVELYGDEMRLRRADERMSKSSDQRKDKKQLASISGSVKEQSEKTQSGLSPNSFKGSYGKKENQRLLALDLDDDDDWDDAPGSNSDKPSSGEYGRYSGNKNQHNSGDYNTESTHQGASKFSRVRDSGDGHCSRQEHSQRHDQHVSPMQVYIGNWPHDATERDLKGLIRPYDCLGCRILQGKDSKLKKYAFVDVRNEEEALRLIKDLNNSVYKNRDLQCRLGKGKPTGDDSRSHNDKPRGSIEQEFDRLNVHRGIPKQDDAVPRLETSGHDDKMPPLETPKKPLLVSPKMPPLETPKKSLMVSPKMPPLETPKKPLMVSPKMPHLETPKLSQSPMPPLEKFDRVPDEMPRLEKVMSPAIPALVNQRGWNDMPILEEISPKGLSNGAADPVQLNVGNFPYGTSEKELMMLLGQYGAQKITIMNKDMTTRSTYAFADFADVTLAVNAMENLDQSFFKGRKLVVILSNPAAIYQQHNAAQMPNLTCTVTDIPPLSPASYSQDIEIAYEPALKPNRINFNYQRLTTTLQEYTKISTKLRADELVPLVEGMTLSVTITHIENEKFFWAQILEDSVNGANRGLQHLHALSREMQVCPRVEAIGGLGRCIAKYEDAWFRAWCTFLTDRNGQEIGDVIFIDYGNRAFVPKGEMIRTKPPIWSLPPMARPFKLVDAKYDLDKYLNQAVTLEVVEAGSHRTNSLTTVRFCWM